ncbi:MAG TPA: cupin domain-containing protein [Myxococcaceae bacterium]|nr:cupin domain-containing protein [Myxococcaceae bacterium]
MSQVLFRTVQALDDARAVAGLRYLEFLRVPDLSGGLYVLEAGTVDPQKPHSEDEVYVVMRGRCRFHAGGEEQEVGPGTVLFVPARVEHRFLEIRERLEALVFFGPAEGSRS